MNFTLPNRTAFERALANARGPMTAAQRRAMFARHNSSRGIRSTATGGQISPTVSDIQLQGAPRPAALVQVQQQPRPRQTEAQRKADDALRAKLLRQQAVPINSLGQTFAAGRDGIGIGQPGETTGKTTPVAPRWDPRLQRVVTPGAPASQPSSQGDIHLSPIEQPMNPTPEQRYAKMIEKLPPAERQRVLNELRRRSSKGNAPAW